MAHHNYGAPLLTIFFFFPKILMAHHNHGAPLLTNFLFLFKKILMAHRNHGAPLLIFFLFSKNTNGAPWHSAPLLVLTSNGAPVTPCATTIIFLLQNY